MRKSVVFLLLAALFCVTGCSESAVMAGNGASMLIACALLWSTINIGRNGEGQGD